MMYLYIPDTSRTLNSLVYSMRSNERLGVYRIRVNLQSRIFEQHEITSVYWQED